MRTPALKFIIIPQKLFCFGILDGVLKTFDLNEKSFTLDF